MDPWHRFNDFLILAAENLVQQTNNGDDDTGDDENAQITDTHNGQSLQKQIYMHTINLQSSL